MPDSGSDLRRQLARRWAGRDPRELANRAVRELPDSASDWEPPPGVTPRQPPISLGIGIPDPPTLPRAELLDAIARALDAKGDGPLRYGFGPGYPPLRAALAERFARERGAFDVDLDWFRLTNGSAGAIDLVCRSLIDPGDVLIAEAPSYMGTLHNFRGVGAVIHSVPVDGEGLVTDALESLLRELTAAGRRVRLIYTISSFQNPTGVTLSLARRRELLRIAAEHDVLILDDEAYAELSFDEPAPPSLASLADGHGVITVGTFSKFLATGLRVGWICARPEWIEFFGRMRFDMGQAPWIHRMLARYMESGALDEHVSLVRAVYAEKSALLGAALERHAGRWLDFDPPHGGFYLWAELRNGLTAEQVWRAGAEEGVYFPGGTSFFPARHDPTGEHIRLAFSWPSREELEEGARRLGSACARAAGERHA